MKFGQELKFNYSWCQENIGGHIANVCSPLLFSCIFNTRFFIETYTKSNHNEDGISTNSENILLRDYCSMEYASELFEQYNVMETNGKFSIPKAILIDILSEKPTESDYSTYGELYLYLMNVVTDRGGFHKVALIQTKELCYFIDTNNKCVLEYEHAEFLEKFFYNKITNLSVLLYPGSGSWMKHQLKNFAHII